MGQGSLFITFEGGEGSGKTTHSKLLCDFLRKRGFKVVYTREPGGVSISEKIREILLNHRNKRMGVNCEMLLYMASRAELVQKKIIPDLKKGAIVICDRFIDATLVYQGYAGGCDKRIIEEIGKLVSKGLVPDKTFLLDIAPEKGLSRAGRKRDRIERRSLIYHRKVREGYLRIAKKEPERVKVVSGDGDIREIQERVRKIVLELVGTKDEGRLYGI